jgi:hypothetical protein
MRVYHSPNSSILQPFFGACLGQKFPLQAFFSLPACGTPRKGNKTGKPHTHAQKLHFQPPHIFSKKGANW